MRLGLERLGIHKQPGESDEEVTQRVFASATSVTTRADLESILLQRLLVAIAKQQNCEGVLWGHSDSRLAALALADVAKGRGGSVSSNIADGPSLHEINFNYPVRDIFKVELQTYAQALGEPLFIETESGTAEQAVPNIRNTSIDNLLSAYISSQGEKYPSIMANVVRTAGKLQVENTDSGALACSFCVMATIPSSHEKGENSHLCYGCERMKQNIKI
jgi:cytoplasmic tRNA 2-thiolation protein 2